MRKRVFLLLPEAYADANPSSYFPTTDAYVRKSTDDYVLMNVYEYFRTSCTKIKATERALDMLGGFDEVWYYGAFGITKPMHCILNGAKKINLPIKELQPLSCKSSFSLVYKFAMEFHPSKPQDDTYWNNCIKACGEYTKDGNPLNSHLIIKLLEYYEEIYRGTSPAVKASDRFNEEFRAALNFAVWAMKNNQYFEDGIDPRKVHKNPTPMLKALLEGFYNYYQTRQTTLELNTI